MSTTKGDVTTTQDGRYELGPILGEGGFGVVYRATQRETGRTVALKVLRAELSEGDHQARARFHREHLIVAGLNHPGIVHLVEVSDPDGDELYAAYELLDGHNLSELIELKGQLSLGRTLDVMLQVLEALTHAHERGVVHRDLKPANIFVLPSSMGSQVAKVLDFGIATVSPAMRQGKADLGTLTDAQDILGTCAFMAPEQILNTSHTRAAADVYAWALVFLECLTGIRVVRGETQTERMCVHLDYSTPHALPPSLRGNATLSAVLTKCLQKRQEDRYSQGRDVLNALASLRMQSSHFAAIHHVPWWINAARIVYDQRRLVWLITVACCVWIGLLLLSPDTPDEEPTPVQHTTVPPKPVEVPKTTQTPPSDPLASVARSVAPIAALHCAGGLVDVGGGCCYPRQRWVPQESRCAGRPVCPEGQIPRGTSCLTLPRDHLRLHHRCQDGSSRDCRQVAERYMPSTRGIADHEDVALYFLEEGCELRNSACCYMAATLLLEDRPRLPRDTLAARALFEQACTRLKHPASCLEAGTLYTTGLPPEHLDTAKAMPMLLEACGGGSQYGCQRLADIYSDPKTIFHNRAQARMLYALCAPTVDACSKRVAELDRGE